MNVEVNQTYLWRACAVAAAYKRACAIAAAYKRACAVAAACKQVQGKHLQNTKKLEKRL
jgi:hypothetical protein